jgi:hypothetical protein
MDHINQMMEKPTGLGFAASEADHSTQVEDELMTYHVTQSCIRGAWF